MSWVFLHSRHLALKSCVGASLLALAGSSALAGNPLIPGLGVSDPHITVRGDRAYLFAGHDPALADWWVWSTSDLVNWKRESVLRPEDTFIAKPYQGDAGHRSAPTGMAAGFGITRREATRLVSLRRLRLPAPGKMAWGSL